MPAFATSTRHHFPVKCLYEEQAAACLGKYFKRFLSITCPILSSKIRDEQFQPKQKNSHAEYNCSTSDTLILRRSFAGHFARTLPCIEAIIVQQWFCDN
ncbi:hypothetical protein T09_11947 [Trichinella sp. T9]|nr:hypothetical protein T09_11947 [Trichinella sp. T9]